MPHCPKCGSEVSQEMAFCPKCGAPLTTQRREDWREELRARREEWRQQRREWRRQRSEVEKSEKGEEWEKTEARHYMFSGPLIGGLVLVILGIMFYFFITNGLGLEMLAALFFVLIGVVVIVAAVYGAVVLERRHLTP